MKITAKARRSDGWWAVEVPEVPGVFTQARRLDQVPEMAIDAVTLMLGIDADEITDFTLVAETDKDSVIAVAKEAKERADEAAKEASLAMREAASALLEDDLTVRDAGKLLGVSPQRISQLVSHG